jgi:hypothetical protein
LADLPDLSQLSWVEKGIARCREGEGGGPFTAKDALQTGAQEKPPTPARSSFFSHGKLRPCIRNCYISLALHHYLASDNDGRDIYSDYIIQHLLSTPAAAADPDERATPWVYTLQLSSQYASRICILSAILPFYDPASGFFRIPHQAVLVNSSSRSAPCRLHAARPCCLQVKIDESVLKPNGFSPTLPSGT